MFTNRYLLVSTIVLNRNRSCLFLECLKRGWAEMPFVARVVLEWESSALQQNEEEKEKSSFLRFDENFLVLFTLAISFFKIVPIRSCRVPSDPLFENFYLQCIHERVCTCSYLVLMNYFSTEQRQEVLILPCSEWCKTNWKTFFPKNWPRSNHFFSSMGRIFYVSKKQLWAFEI